MLGVLFHACAVPFGYVNHMDGDYSDDISECIVTAEMTHRNLENTGGE